MNRRRDQRAPSPGDCPRCEGARNIIIAGNGAPCPDCGGTGRQRDPNSRLAPDEVEAILLHLKTNDIDPRETSLEIWSKDGKDRHIGLRMKDGSLTEITVVKGASGYDPAKLS
jgi:hypothetical protein